MSELPFEHFQSSVSEFRIQDYVSGSHHLSGSIALGNFIGAGLATIRQRIKIQA